MLGEVQTELDEGIGDATGELTNMISGQARQKLEELGKSFSAAIPTVVMGEGHKVTNITTHPVVAIPFTTDNGEFTIEVCFEK
jgi:chemotaxis protein CheX